ncbi:glycosyltransferase family A protein [Flavobacterium sp. MC2016-06]|jgi:glycosyltransferase involved in cell wall biosynthesis|uniref:glycosyltransferase family A protein n=1 Tax=Flavobacterium sp. MC2016-06 TaxID=2676308 RepID=UPI0012BB03A6|nr:glycosyltransferase family A protein [Flavobacterium sp. MC2016-06]MBU3858660.1 glycosyltransferase family 2 protein [Flavobacterium sp. MC2016-06]
MNIIPRLSIITPCYNSEATLHLTLESVFKQKFQDWEVIIVNDGSADRTEEIALDWVKKDKRFKYFSKENEGLGKTRNFGISKANGTYILPLDSDNLIESDFTLNALKIFEDNPDVGVVHGYAEFFGEREGLWKIDDFDIQKMLVHNYIDACAVFKKELWQKVGGYDQNMPYQGHEDWEFWVSLASINTVFYNLHLITFKYFVSSKSMIHSFNNEMVFLNQDYIMKKHSKLFHEEYSKIFSSREKMDKQIMKKLKSKKFVVDLFCSTFFGFKVFNRSINLKD